MLSIITPALLFAFAAPAAAKGVWVTPHDSYSSSIGALGCKLNTDRVAYWPGSIDCDNICVKLTYEGRSVHLLRIDQSQGAHDVSYDAWNYLQTGKSAAVDPITGGAVAMEYEEVDASECADLIYTDGSKLPLSASNSINFLTSCLAQPDSWVANNYVLYNICDAICSLGYDEECELDLNVSNQPSCKHTLGLTTKLTSTSTYNIEYESGTTVDASTGEVVAAEDTEDSVESSSAEQPAPQQITTSRTSAAAPSSSSASTSTTVQTRIASSLSPPTTQTAVGTSPTYATFPSNADGPSTTSGLNAGKGSHSPGVFVTVDDAAQSQSTTSTGKATLSSSASQAAVTSSNRPTTTFSVATISTTQSAASSSTPTVEAESIGTFGVTLSQIMLFTSTALCCLLTAF